MKTKLFAIIFSFICVSCHMENQRAFVVGRTIVSNKSETERNLSPSESFSGPSLFGATRLLCVVDSIAIFNLRDKSYSFLAVNINNNDYVRFMNIGRGPDEIISGLYTGVRVVNDTTLMEVDALNESYIYEIDVNGTYKERKAVIRDKVVVNQDAIVSFIINDDILSFVLYDGDNYSIKQYGNKGEELTRSVQLFGDELYLIEYQPQFESDRRVKPDGTKLVMPMLRFDELDIYDIVGEDHISVSTSKRTNSKAIISSMLSSELLGNQIYYYGCDVTDNAIYALYYDCPMGKLDSSLPDIQVFSWDGELKAIYHLNETINSIAVSPDGKSLYGLTNNEIFYRYDLE